MFSNFFLVFALVNNDYYKKLFWCCVQGKYPDIPILICLNSSLPPGWNSLMGPARLPKRPISVVNPPLSLLGTPHSNWLNLKKSPKRQKPTRMWRWGGVRFACNSQVIKSEASLKVMSPRFWEWVRGLGRTRLGEKLASCMRTSPLALITRWEKCDVCTYHDLEILLYFKFWPGLQWWRPSLSIKMTVTKLQQMRYHARKFSSLLWNISHTTSFAEEFKFLRQFYRLRQFFSCSGGDF